MNLEGCRALSSRGGSWSVGRCETRGRTWALMAPTSWELAESLLKATKLCWALGPEKGAGREEKGKKNP